MAVEKGNKMAVVVQQLWLQRLLPVVTHDQVIRRGWLAGRRRPHLLPSSLNCVHTKEKQCNCNRPAMGACHLAETKDKVYGMCHLIESTLLFMPFPIWHGEVGKKSCNWLNILYVIRLPLGTLIIECAVMSDRNFCNCHYTVVWLPHLRPLLNQ